MCMMGLAMADPQDDHPTLTVMSGMFVAESPDRVRPSSHIGADVGAYQY